MAFSSFEQRATYAKSANTVNGQIARWLRARYHSDLLLLVRRRSIGGLGSARSTERGLREKRAVVRVQLEQFASGDSDVGPSGAEDDIAERFAWASPGAAQALVRFDPDRYGLCARNSAIQEEALRGQCLQSRFAENDLEG